MSRRAWLQALTGVAAGLLFVLAGCADEPEPIIIETPVITLTAYATPEPTARPRPTPRPTRTPRPPTPTPRVVRVNINTADAVALEALPRIGPATARRIIEYRQQHGPFASVEDIQKVPGVGPATFEAIKPYITIDD
ncbi:MAG: helix-hairpin-helix domain-containing protein [Anaerolineae bacterium]|nr:helix-hairpin-helix domain-containing protein [Thermoflexales bacterium]MDW8406845.1 helix-hairpin-helix domain-containing protein [Anaerolineae bacterium]